MQQVMQNQLAQSVKFQQMDRSIVLGLYNISRTKHKWAEQMSYLNCKCERGRFVIVLKLLTNFLCYNPQVTSLITGKINKARDFASWADKHMYSMSS